ncbi:hypothetical protein PR202_ga28821 [Eleusine coracana subsp. coracana]|uniref:Uncharacterized protein n=1 Tax=Eleusine coracana subsp. coracana TaxID=191504 RepID=A0AAV5DJ89_ELECO|nr:hypothetical protein PR202_ga28821 [Eleusine coracana subsp. coracana]
MLVIFTAQPNTLSASHVPPGHNVVGAGRFLDKESDDDGGRLPPAVLRPARRAARVPDGGGARAGDRRAGLPWRGRRRGGQGGPQGAPGAHGISSLLPVGLVIVIRVLSSDRGAAALTDVFYLGGRPDTVHRAGGSPVGVALFLLVIVMLLYYRVSLFGGDAGDDE